MKTAKGIVAISVEVECPSCGYEMDVCLQENELFRDNKLPNPSSTNEVFTCVNCQEGFLMNEIEY